MVASSYCVARAERSPASNTASVSQLSNSTAPADSWWGSYSYYYYYYSAPYYYPSYYFGYYYFAPFNPVFYYYYQPYVYFGITF